MADKKISSLTELTTPASADEFAIVDSSATETKRLTWANLLATQASATQTLTNKTLTSPDINGGTVDAITSLTVANNIDIGAYTITATGFIGALTGNVTGDLTGNAGSATILETARTINGVAFDGSANITVTADANTLTGTTLKSSVVSSSLTSVGTLTDLTVTNAIIGSITGQAGTVATITGLAPDTATTQATQPNITSLGTLTGLTMGGNIVMGDHSITGIDTLTFTDTAGTIAGIANGNLLDKSIAVNYFTNDLGIGMTSGISSYARVNIQGEKNTSYNRRKGILTIQDTANFAQGVGGAIILGGKMNADGTLADFALIEGYKENATSNEYGGEMRFYTRANGADLAERMRIDSAGGITISGLSGNAGYYVKVDSSGKLYTEAS